MIARILGVAIVSGSVWVSCTDNTPVTTSDVITSLAIMPTPGFMATADGVSRATVTITTVTDDGRDPNLKATLQLSDGMWLFPDASSPKAITLPLKDSSASADFVLPRQPETIEVIATLDGFTQTASLATTPTPILKVDVSADGQLPGSGSGAATGGPPSLPSGPPGLPINNPVIHGNFQQH